MRRLGTALLVLICWSLIAWIGARLLIVRVPLNKADASVMLSGSSTYLERAELTARLFQQGRAPKIILTNDNQRGGWSNAEQRNPFFYESALADLQRRGVPRNAIEVIMQPVFGTSNEAATLRQYAEAQKLHSLLIVTSGYHSRRAFLIFRRVFAGSDIRIGIEPVDAGIQTPKPSTWWLHSSGWNMIPAECLKLVYLQFG